MWDYVCSLWWLSVKHYNWFYKSGVHFLIDLLIFIFDVTISDLIFVITFCWWQRWCWGIRNTTYFSILILLVSVLLVLTIFNSLFVHSLRFSNIDYLSSGKNKNVFFLCKYCVLPCLVSPDWLVHPAPCWTDDGTRGRQPDDWFLNECFYSTVMFCRISEANLPIKKVLLLLLLKSFLYLQIGLNFVKWLSFFYR